MGHQFYIMGQVQILINHAEKQMPFFMFVCQAINIMGLDLINVIWPKLVTKLSKETIITHITYDCGLCDFIEKASNVEGGMKVKPIQIDYDDSKPVFINNRPIAYGLHNSVKANLDKMIESGIIRTDQSLKWQHQ